MQTFNDSLSAWLRERFPDRAERWVPGEGPRGARVMLIGEAPGEQEALLHRPFVGKAGKNLDELLEAAGLRREEMYVTNAVKFRPTALSPAGRTVNRTPSAAEVEAFLPWLKREIEAISPEWVVTLGNVPLKALLGRAAVIGQLHGTRLPLPGAEERGWLYPVYHPASLIYNRALRPAYEADLARLKALLAEGCSDLPGETPDP